MIVSALATLILVLLISWIVRSVRNWRWLHAGPIENHPVRIYDVQFAKEFNDLNEVQLSMAQAVGIPPVQDRQAAEHLKGKLVEITDNDLYHVEELTHSIPYLIPSAVDLLDRIGRNFQDSLAAKGLNPNKLVVTSVLRTEEDTTFDLSYWRYVKVPELRGRPYADVPPEHLRATLSQVLKDLHDEGACYVKYEKKQNCFHITVRK